MEYLLIDGYNVINAWDDIFNVANNSLEDCRDKLVGILSDYEGYTKFNIIVVFDAHFVKRSQRNTTSYDNITVVFTKENETADNYIERFVYKLETPYRVRVVTLDYLEQTIVLSNGGIRVTPKELRDEVEAARKGPKTNLKSDFKKTNTIMSNIKPEFLEVLEKIRRGKF